MIDTYLYSYIHVSLRDMASVSHTLTLMTSPPHKTHVFSGSSIAEISKILTLGVALHPSTSTLPHYFTITMSKGSLRIKLESVAAFATAFLVTDYLWYTQKPKYINSIVWARVLDSKDVAAKQQNGLPGNSSGPTVT